VPDTHQKSVLAALDKEEQIRVLTCAPEDEAATIAGGLYIGGAPVVLKSSTRALRLRESASWRGHGRPHPDLLHDRALEPRERQGALVGA
jgi:hypothetical protein